MNGQEKSGSSGKGDRLTSSRNESNLDGRESSAVAVPPFWSTDVVPALSAYCPRCGSPISHELTVLHPFFEGWNPQTKVEVICSTCGSRGHLRLPDGLALVTKADLAPVVVRADDDPPISAVSEQSSDIQQHLPKAAAQAAPQNCRFTDSTQRRTIGSWCCWDPAIDELWRSLGPTRGSGLQVSSVAQALGLTGPAVHRSTCSEHKPLYSRTELLACLAVLQRQSPAPADSEPLPVAIEPDAAGMSSTRLQLELHTEAG